MANWFSPAIVNKLGVKASLFLSAMPYTGFIFCMVEPYVASVFVLSAMLGAGGGVIWTANGEVSLGIRLVPSCTALYHLVLYCNVLYCLVLSCTALYRLVPYQL